MTHLHAQPEPILEEYAFFVNYKGELVCHWGGERVVQRLPYKRGPGARGDQ